MCGPYKHHSLTTAQRAAVWVATIALLFCLVGVLIDDWARQPIELVDRDDPNIYRGLFSLTIDGGYGQFAATVYREEDVDNERNDPFCGDKDRPSIFYTTFPVFFEQGELSKFLFDPDSADDTAVFKNFRDDDTNNWCSLSRAAFGLAIVQLIFAFGVWFVSFLRYLGGGAKMAFIVLSFISLACGICVTAIVASWVHDQNEDIDRRNLPQEGIYHMAPSWVLLLLAWLLHGIVIIIELAVPDTSDEEDAPPANAPPAQRQ